MKRILSLPPPGRALCARLALLSFLGLALPALAQDPATDAPDAVPEPPDV